MLGWAKNNGWIPKISRTIPYRIDRGANTGRTLQVMEPQDAGDLYRLMHRHPTVVIQIGQPTVRLNPWAEPAERNVISLERFVRYKAFFKRLGREGSKIDIPNFLNGFQDWRQSCTCDGERDARCIPLHVFNPNLEWKELHNVEGVRAFEFCHGKAGSRVDYQNREWNPPTALHGQQITVAGATLRSGFHWDVVSPHGDGRLCTSTEIWRFSRGSYCNVYPDAAVRRGQRKGDRARRIYEAQRPDGSLASGTRSKRPDGQRRRPT